MHIDLLSGILFNVIIFFMINFLVPKRTYVKIKNLKIINLKRDSTSSLRIKQVHHNLCNINHLEDLCPALNKHLTATNYKLQTTNNYRFGRVAKWCWRCEWWRWKVAWRRWHLHISVLLSTSIYYFNILYCCFRLLLLLLLLLYLTSGILYNNLLLSFACNLFAFMLQVSNAVAWWQHKQFKCCCYCFFFHDDMLRIHFTGFYFVLFYIFFVLFIQ